MARRQTPVPQPAYRDALFMESAAARPVRILTEYLDPLARLRRQGIGDTIVMFGSARILPRDVALSQVKALAGAAGEDTPELRAAARHAEAALTMSRYYEEARELSARLTKWSRTLGDSPSRFVICSGGGPGIMEAANRGAADAGGKTIALNIELPHEQAPNRYTDPDLSFLFHYFFMRKLWFAQLAKALIVFPGGFGTMDEMWEILTLMQTGKLQRRNLILIYGREYWNQVVNWKEMLNWGTISESDYSLLEFADSVDEAFERVKRGLEEFHMAPDNLLFE